MADAQIPCPLCEAAETRPLCEKDGYPIRRCPECATDFIAEAPDAFPLDTDDDRAARIVDAKTADQRYYDQGQMPPLPLFEKILDEFGPGGEGRSVLDIGCGDGTHLEQAHRRGWKCFGVEVSAQARQVISQRHGYKFFIADGVDQLIPHAFDLVVLFDAIEHLADPRSIFYTLFAKGSITPATTVVITTPNARSFSALSQPTEWAYRHAPSQRVYFSGQSLASLLRQLRFHAVEILGQHEERTEPTALYQDEPSTLNGPLANYGGLFAKASGSDFGQFMQERYVPGTWSKLAEYEHLPRYLFAQTLAEGRNVLDFGCGTGYGTAILARQAVSVTGIDIDAEAIDWARGQHRAVNLSFEQWTDLGASKPAASFDLITCFEMIEHVAETTQVEAVRHFARLLAEDGLALISTPNPAITQLYGPNPYHIREMNKREFASLLREHFQYVELFEQFVQPSVLISPTQADGRASRIRGLNWNLELPSDKEPAIFIAACSQRPIPVLDEYCFQDFRAHYIANQLAAAQALNNARLKHFAAVEQAASVAVLQEDLADKGRALQTQAAEIHRLDSAVKAKEQALVEQAGQIHRLEDFAADKDKALTQQAAEIHRLDQVLADKDAALDRQAAEIHRLDQVLADKDAALDRQAAEIHRLDQVLADKDAALDSQTVEIRRLDQVVVDKDQALATQADEIHQLHGQLNETLANKAQAIAELERVLRQSAINEAEQAAELSRLEHALAEKERQLVALRQGNWHKLGLAITQKNAGLKKLLTVPYYLGACLMPHRFKPSLYPLVARLKRLGARPHAPAIPEISAPLRQEASTKPRVLHVIANFMLGGSSRLVVDLIEGLGDTYEHKVVTSLLPSPPAYAGVDASEFRYPVAEDAVAQYLRDYDPLIIHVHYWGDCDWWWYDLFFRAAKNQRCRVIENVNTPVEPYQAEFIDRYVHVSRYVEQTFGDGGSHNMTIYPGSDFSHFARQPQAELAADCIGMVYRLEGDKLNEQSIEVFIKVVQRRPQTKAVIVGGGTYLEPYRQAVQAAQMEGNFEFTGYVDYSILPRLYERMTIFVAPVWKESFGQVSPFAMNMGIPVVGYNVGGLGEIVDDPALLATPGDSDELAELIVQLLDDPARCRQISARNHARAQAVFSVEAMIGAYRELYAELAEIPQ